MFTRLQTLRGKRILGTVNAVGQSHKSTSPRLFVRDRRSNLRFLIDTGSDVSIIPRSLIKKVDVRINYLLQAANESKIQVYGIKLLELDFGLTKQYKWTFIIAEVTTPILGADFMKVHCLLPDLNKKILIDNTTLVSTACISQHSQQPSVYLVTNLPEVKEEIRRLLQQYPKLMQPPQYVDKPNHNTVHYINTRGTPIYQKPRRLQPKLEKEVKQEFRNLLSVGVVRQSQSPWASPIVVVKNNKGTRIAGDYRRLNAQTIPDRYPLPNLFDFSANLSNSKYFSCVDLVRAYFNIPVYSPHIKKTAVISPAGLFEYTRMPFGLKNAPSTFMRFISSVLNDLPFLFVYLDDILVFSNTKSQHLEYLQILFQRLNDYGLTINLKKSVFCVESVEFLGHRVTAEGLKPTSQRIEFFKNLSKPLTISGLRKLMGVFNFYSRFVKNAAQFMAPFYELLKIKSRKNDKTKINWTNDLDNAFAAVKAAFSNFVLLHFPQDDVHLLLTTDASNVAIGGVLEQVTATGERQPLAFYSRKLTDNESRWSTYDKELLALYASVEHFRHLVEGRELQLITDHKPLIYMFQQKKPIKLQRRSRYIEYISQYTTQIKHVSGLSNIVADALSRPEVNMISNNAAKLMPVTVKNIAEAQENSEEIQKLRISGYRDHVLRDVKFNDQLLFCSFWQGINRPVVPNNLRFSVFRKLHDISHPGKLTTFRLISRQYFWPRMKNNIREWVQACHGCQRAKITKHTVSPTGEFKDCGRFTHVHMDIVILPDSDGYRYLCTFIDRKTRWIEAEPLKQITAEQIAKVFYNTWISRYGVPEKVTSDRGPQFRSELFRELCALLGIDAIQTTAYNPKANGIIERWHRVLKAGLMSRGGDWLQELTTVLMGLRAVPKGKSFVSAAEMTFGQAIRLPGEFYSPSQEIQNKSLFVKQLRYSIGKIRPVPFNHNSKNKIFVHPDLNSCEQVFVRVDRVRQPLEPPYEGPFPVVKRKPKYFIIQLHNKQDSVSIDRLKPAYTLNAELYEGIKKEATKEEPKSILKSNSWNIQEDSGKIGDSKYEKCGKSISLYKTNSCNNNDSLPVPPVFNNDPLPLPPVLITSAPQQSEIKTSSSDKFYKTTRGRTIKPPVRFNL